jgi:fibronectin-binding autotransporter adhesin
MSTHSLRKKLLRSRPAATKGQRTLSKIRKYAPWVAAICVGAYLPPKVMSSVWKFDADGIWNSGGPTGNWTNGIVPNNNGQIADFTLNFTADRTISLAGPPSISPIVSQVRFDDTSPSSVLTIRNDGTTKLSLRAAVGQTQGIIDVSKGNTLKLDNTASAAGEVLGPETSGINKTGSGLFNVVGVGTYTGVTTITQGIWVATILANGSTQSSIGASPKNSNFLVFSPVAGKSGTLRYVSPGAAAVITDRSFQIGPGGATIDSSSASGAATLIFGTNFTVFAQPIAPSGTTNILVGAGPGTTIASTADGDRKLTLRGTNIGTNSTLVIGPNEIQATIPDFGNPQGLPNGFHTTLEKLDTGTWRLSAALMPATGGPNDGKPWTTAYDSTNPTAWLGNLTYGNTYTGDTIVQRGTLQLLFAPLPLAQNNTNTFQYVTGSSLTEKHLGVINPNSRLQLGSVPGSGLPGGGTLELIGGNVQRLLPADPQAPGKVLVTYSGAIQDFNDVVINSGANSITRVAFGTSINGTTNNEFVYVNDGSRIIHNPGGTLRLAADALLRVGPVLPLYVNGIFNGWLHRDDNWAFPTAVDSVQGTGNLSPNYATRYNLNSTGNYTGANDTNGASVLTEDSNVLQNSTFSSVFSNGSTTSAGNQRFINSIKFDATLPANQANKQFRISDGDDFNQPDFGAPPTTLALKSGGFMASSSNGITQVLGGRITSGSGDFSLDTTDPQNPIFINRGGGTLGQSEIFAIIRSGAANGFYLSSAIVDYYSRFGQDKISVGLTKSGGGTLILLDSTSTGLKGAARSTFQGDVYINEGTLAIRADSALGQTIDRTDIYTDYSDPNNPVDVLPNYGADGTHGQTYLLGNTAILDFQGVRYTLPEKINVNQGEIQASIGRSTFAGVINNLNEEEKVILRVGTYLELNGDISTDGKALIGVGGYRKLGNGILVVNGGLSIGTHLENGIVVKNTSEFPGSGDLTLEVGSSVWNGPIDITNGSIVVSAPPILINGVLIPQYSSFNGLITIDNGHLVNSNSLVAFTKPGQNFTVELQQSGASAQTLFGNLNQLPADGAQVYTGPITVGTVLNGVSQPGGSLAVNGSIDFGTSVLSNPIDLTRGSFSQVAVVNASYIPTTRFYGPVTFGLTGTITLNHNTLFNETLTLGQAASAVNLVANGLGHTTFNGPVNVVNGNLTLTDTSFTLPYTQQIGTLTLNGLDTFNKNGSGSALTVTGGTIVEAGSRRSAGVYGVRTTFNGDLTIAPPAASATTVAMTFSGNNDVQGNINVTGQAPLTGVTLQRADVTFANAQNLTGNLVVTGGQVKLQNSNALGAGSATPGVLGGLGGVTLQGEKPVLLFERGVATATGEDITIGASATAYLSGVAITNYGSSYTAGATVSITGGTGAGGINATGTTTVTGTQLVSIALNNVGQAYNAVPSITTTPAGGGSFAPVFGGTVIRGVDQHNVIDGALIFNNVTGGKLNLGVPMLSVGADDSLQIKGDIFGVANITQANTAIYGTGQLAGRLLTTAILGGGTPGTGLNSSGGIIILSGQVKDTASGATTGLNVLNTEWVGSNDLNIQVEKPWNSNGLIQMAQGVMRYTNPTPNATFFANSTPNFALSVPNTAFGHASVGFNSVAGNGIQNTAFFLTQPGQTFNANGFSVYLGNSNKLSLDGASTGFAVIGGENTTGTVTYGNHFGNITLDVDSSSLGGLRDLRIFANAGGTVDIQNSFVRASGQTNGQISIDKVGDGTAWLSGAAPSGTTLPAVGTQSVLDRVFILGGTLELRNFGQYTGQRLTTAASAQTFLGGGTLRLFTGAATGSVAAAGAITQSVQGNITLRNGLSSLQVQSGGLASTLQIGSGGVNFSRNVGGVLWFAKTGAGANIIMNAASGLGTRSSANPYTWSSYGTSLDPTSSLAATNFAYIDGTTFAVSPYTAATTAANDNLAAITVNTPHISEANGGFQGKLPASYSGLTTVRFTGNATGAGRGILDLGQDVGTPPAIATGAIMLASDATGNTRIIQNGSLMPVGAADLILQNWGGDGVGANAPKLLVSAKLTNNAANDSVVTIAGDGTTQLTGANDFRGSVYLSGGTLEVASAAPLGSDSLTPTTFKNLFMDGATLHNTGDFTWDKRNIVVYGERSTIQIDSGKTFTLLGSGTSAGGINSQAPEVVNANNVTYGGTSTVPATGKDNIFSGDLVISGQGTFQQVRDNVANTIAGQLFVQGNAKLAFEGNNFTWMGNNLSWMDGTTVASGATLELRPTVNSGASTVGEWLHLSGSGQPAIGNQPAAGGALVLKRPEAVINNIFVNAAAALTDHSLSWTGPVTMDAATTIFVDDKPEVVAAGFVGQLTFDDNIFDGGNSTLTKAGLGTLRFNNGRIQNLPTIQINSGEVRFEGGILGTIGSEANKIPNGLLHTGAGLAPAASFNNFTSGTNSIVVGTGATSTFATGGRLAFVDVRGTHTADITLKNGYMFVQSSDAPLQATSFAGDFNLIGTADSNAIEAIYTNRVNPIVMFGAFNGTGGFTKFGNNEIDFVNPNSTFSGEIQVSRGGGSITSPGVGLYDGGRFINVSSVRLTNDGSFFLDSQNSLANATPSAANNRNDRINDNAAIHVGGASRLRLLGNNFVPTTEAMGVLNVHLGSSAVTMDPSPSGQNIGLSFDNYTRDAGGVVNFRVLKAGTNFGSGIDDVGNPLSTGSATITVRGNIAAPFFKGGAGLNRFNDPDPSAADPQSKSIVIGAFGSVVTRDYSSLPANSSLPLALNNNDQPFAGRGMMTIDAMDDGNGNITKYLRPLNNSEYLNATRTGIRVTDTYDFDSYFTKGHEDPLNPGQFPEVANGSRKNVRLLGGFGPSTSAIAETLFATENFYLFDQRDDSRKQDSLYRVLANVEFNSLTFAQQTTEVVDGGGNRVILEISGDKTLKIGSGMILHAGLGIIGAAAPNVSFNSTQSALIRGGTLDFGNTEGIIQNVAAGLNETTGVFSSFRQTGSSPIANNNIGASDLTISSSIAGSLGLTKSGPSTVNLSGVNTYSGPTNVVEGILRLENNQALGNSHLVTVSGTGELRMQRGITVGNPSDPHGLKVQFASMAQPAVFRAEAGNNLFYGDILINTLNEAGDRVSPLASAFDVSLVNGTGASFTIGGDIYGVDTAGGGINPLNDVQRGRQSRIVNFNNASTFGGVMQIRGSFRDLQSGAVSSFVQSDNEEQVLRSAFTGFTNSNFFVASSWDAAGSILLRQGALHFTTATDFFSKAASNAINPSNAQAHPIIGDLAGISAADVLLSLTTGGQVFNSPTLQIINNASNANVTIGGENTSGTVKFFAPSLSSAASTQFNSASVRVSSWDRNVRLYAANGGTVEVHGRITDVNNGSIAKIGPGTVIMKGMDGATAGYVNGTSNNNDFDKGIFVGSGKLVLDTNVDANTTVANVYGIASTPLTLGGGKLEIRGDTDPTARATETWNGIVTLKAGASELALVPNAGGITLALGSGQATTRSTGGTVNFVTPGSTGVISYLSTTGVGATGSMLGPWASFGALPGTATDFAATGAGDATRTLIALTGYTTQSDASLFAANNYANEAAAGFINDSNKALAASIKLLRFGAPAIASTLNIAPAGVTMGTGGADEGAILVPTGTTALKTITGGSLTVNAGKELFIHNYGTGGLNLQTPIIGASPIVLSGPGTTTLGRNKQTGAVYLNDGVTSIDKLNFEPLTVNATQNQTVFTLSNTDLANVRTGSTVVGSTGANLGTVLRIDGNQVTITTAAPAGTSSITINPSSAVITAVSLAAVTSGTTGTVAANTVGLAVGASVTGTGVPAGTTITGISNGGTTVTFSSAISGSQALTLAVPNGLGQAIVGSLGLNINGATLQYTGGSVLTDRNLTVGDGGATVEVTQPTTSLMINTLVGGNSVVTGGTSNPYATSFTKTGPGTLVVSQAAAGNTHSGLTDVRAGTLTFLSTATPFGTSTNALDGTFVRNGGTLRLQQGADLTTQEWFTFRTNSTLDYAPTTANRKLTLDGVINVTGPSTWSYSGANAGSAIINLNSNAGYLTGAGSINKGTVNNGLGGQLVLTESNPEFSGGFSIEGGRLIIKSVGNPTGTGAAGLPINLGTAQANDLTSSTSKGSPDARIIFQIRDVVNADGGTTLTGAFDSFQVNVGIPQEIVVQRPADALPGQASSQIKQIGVAPDTSTVPPTGGTGLSLDQYSLNGNLRLKDDLEFYVEDSFTRVNYGEEYVNFNINGHIITDSPDYIPTFRTKLNITGRPNGSAADAYNNLYAVISLNNSNPNFVGNLVVGNPSGVDANNQPLDNKDANHVLRLNHDQALNANNPIALLNNVTVQVTGHNVTIGSLTDATPVGTDKTATQFSGGLTTGYISLGMTQIVENGSGTPSILTINQTVDADWSMLFRDGYTADGARTGSLALVKTGPGLVRFKNPNDFSGGLTVLDGTVLVRNSGATGSATGGGKVDVIGARFGGDNTSPIAGDLTIMNAGTRQGVLAPGDVPFNNIHEGGTLNVGKVTFASTAGGSDRVEIETFTPESQSGNDRVFLTSLDVNAPVTLDLRLFAAEDGSTGHIFTAGDPIDLDGEFFRLFVSSENHIQFGPNGGFYYNNQRVQDGSDLFGYYLDEAGDPTTQAYVMRLSISDVDVRLTAIPEPNVALSLIAGAGALLGLGRFRRRGARV